MDLKIIPMEWCEVRNGILKGGSKETEQNSVGEACIVLLVCVALGGVHVGACSRVSMCSHIDINVEARG